MDHDLGAPKPLTSMLKKIEKTEIKMGESYCTGNPSKRTSPW